MPKDGLSIAEKAENFRAEYEKQEINLLLMYERAMKLLNHQLGQLENALLGGMNYKEADKRAPEPKIVKMSCDLAKTIKDVTKLHMEIAKSEMKSAAGRTLEQKMQFATEFLAKLPAGYRQKAIEGLSEQLQLNIERRFPTGRRPDGYIHPMDR